MNDITYCSNFECDKKDCFRHISKCDKGKVYAFFRFDCDDDNEE